MSAMSPGNQGRRSNGSGEAIDFADRLLAETVRIVEHDGSAPIEDPAAEQRARELGGSFEQRIVARAAQLPRAKALRAELQRVDRSIGLIVAVLLVIAMVAGAGAARALLDVRRDESVNFFWVFGGLLAIQTLFLPLWVALMIAGPRALSGGSLGGMVMAGARSISARFDRSPQRLAALNAVGATTMAGAIGRWTFSAVSHCAWTAFNVGALVLVVLLLSTRHYTFTWETTILSAEAYERISQVIGRAPAVFGFEVPTPAEITGSQWPVDPDIAETTRQAWSGLLIGSIAIYGLGPRLILLAMSMLMRRRAVRCWVLDTTRPGFLRLRERLMPQARQLGVIDPDQSDDTNVTTGPPAADNDRAVGPPAILGLEIDRPASGWPPPAAAIWDDLGIVDSREDRQQAVARLVAAAKRPGRMIVTCSLATTPDRGIARFLGEVGAAAGAPLSLVLTGGQVLRARGDASLLEHRIEDWRALASRLDIPDTDVAEIDLDHLTEASIASLAALVAESAKSPVRTRHIERAFDRVVGHASNWSGAPTTKEQAKLHREIGEIYRAERTEWRTFLSAPADLTSDLKGQLTGGVNRVMSVLPDRLRLNWRWTTAGALAGALGCVTAATFVAPAAVAVLPMWTAVGAAVTTAVNAFRAGSNEASDQPGETSLEFGDAVRAAALFALLLELQPLAEIEITRVLDRVLSNEPDTETLNDASQVAYWLDGCRHRLDLALAEEAER